MTPRRRPPPRRPGPALLGVLLGLAALWWATLSEAQREEVRAAARRRWPTLAGLLDLPTWVYLAAGAAWLLRPLLVRVALAAAWGPAAAVALAAAAVLLLATRLQADPGGGGGAAGHDPDALCAGHGGVRSIVSAGGRTLVACEDGTHYDAATGAPW